jgi:hypothetical protein
MTPRVRIWFDTSLKNWALMRWCGFDFDWEKRITQLFGNFSPDVIHRDGDFFRHVGGVDCYAECIGEKVGHHPKRLTVKKSKWDVFIRASFDAAFHEAVFFKLSFFIVGRLLAALATVVISEKLEPHVSELFSSSASIAIAWSNLNPDNIRKKTSATLQSPVRCRTLAHVAASVATWNQ